MWCPGARRPRGGSPALGVALIVGRELGVQTVHSPSFASPSCPEVSPVPSLCPLRGRRLRAAEGEPPSPFLGLGAPLGSVSGGAQRGPLSPPPFPLTGSPGAGRACRPRAGPTHTQPFSALRCLPEWGLDRPRGRCAPALPPLEGI